MFQVAPLADRRMADTSRFVLNMLMFYPGIEYISEYYSKPNERSVSRQRIVSKQLTNIIWISAEESFYKAYVYDGKIFLKFKINFF